MSQFIDFTLPSTVPGRTLHGFRCVPEGQVRAVLQLSHGMVEYIDRYRVNHARTELLMPGDSRSMEEIAVGAGFTSSRTFSRIFQKILGVTPAQYRRQAQ